MNRGNLDFNDDKTILDIYNCANEVYGGGIAVPVESGHPCGWEWINFDDIDDVLDDILKHEFEDYEISGGYSNGDYVNKTLKQILKETDGKFVFEIGANNINWYED